MKNIIFILILFLVSPNTINGQVFNIKNIQNSTLLIRLTTNENLINYHLTNGDFEQAELIRKKQTSKNQKIIDAFETEWSSCKVYFFYSNYSSEIQNNTFKNLFKDVHETKLNNNEKQEVIDHRKNAQLIIGYFGKTNGTLKFNALVLMNHEFKKIKKPMPKYVRTYEGLWFLKRNTKKVVQILEKKIQWNN